MIDIKIPQGLGKEQYSILTSLCRDLQLYVLLQTPHTCWTGALETYQHPEDDNCKTDNKDLTQQWLADVDLIIHLDDFHRGALWALRFGFTFGFDVDAIFLQKQT